MTLELNLDGVEAWKGEGPLPPGEYVCRITEADEGRSSGGHPQLELEMRVVVGDYTGGTIRDWLVITEGTRGKVRALLEGAGIQIPAGTFALEPVMLRGRPVEIVVRQEDYNGEPKIRVKAYRAPSGGQATAQPGGGQQAMPVAQPVSAGVGAGAIDDDIPF
jgi:Protein of unknown function (DUF669)